MFKKPSIQKNVIDVVTNQKELKIKFKKLANSIF